MEQNEILFGLGFRVFVIVFTPIFLLLCLAFYRRTMSKMHQTWETFASEHKLTPVTETYTVNYGQAGSRNFQSPGLKGEIAGYTVEAVLIAITQWTIREGHGWRIRGIVTLHHQHPRLTLLHRRRLYRDIMQALPPKVRVTDRQIRKNFIVYAKNPPDGLVGSDVAQQVIKAMKAQFRTISIQIEANTLTFEGKPRKQSIQPQHVYTVMHTLAELATWVDSWIDTPQTEAK